ncbi:hypothetical protein Gogos_018260 [Gossypium gossypioides]|uniref:Uncharacterized protein n=1 Tax=Gossypium gossypioides TaxID=34282 RepID=A0A7J9BDE1_GOSGO|nr:hypothetical protein [Gossypium gossypioides]
MNKRRPLTQVGMKSFQVHHRSRAKKQPQLGFHLAPQTNTSTRVLRTIPVFRLKLESLGPQGSATASPIGETYMLKKHPCGDCLVHCCCEYCALCQEYRELKTRGYDLSIGWHGNMEKRSREVAMTPIPPVVEDGMSR